MKKSIDVITQRMFGLAAIIFAVCFGIASITNNPAKADNPTTVNSTGKIMIDQNAFIKEGQFFYHIIVWDTETGKSKLYIFKQSTGVFGSTPYQLPSSPLY